MQACLLWKVKLCRFLHASVMFPLKTLRELWRILHTPGMNSWFWVFFPRPKGSGSLFSKTQKFWISFFPRPKTSDSLAVIHHPMDAFHVEVACMICSFCVRSACFLYAIYLFFVGPGLDPLPLQHDYFVGPGFEHLPLHQVQFLGLVFVPGQ